MRPGESSTKPNLDWNWAGSRCRVPCTPISSHTEKSTSTRGCLAPDAWTRRRPSRMAATPERSSAARTVVPSETIFPSRTCGLMPKPFWTRSTWAASRTEPSVCPSSTAIRFPAVPSTLDAVSSSRTVQPRASSFPFSASTMARSLTGDRVDLRQLDEFFYNRYCHAASSLFVMVSQRCGTCAPSQNVLPWTPCGIATGVPIFGPSAETIANTGLSVPEHGLADVTGV